MKGFKICDIQNETDGNHRFHWDVMIICDSRQIWSAEGSRDEFLTKSFPFLSAEPQIIQQPVKETGKKQNVILCLLDCVDCTIMETSIHQDMDLAMITDDWDGLSSLGSGFSPINSLASSYIFH